MLPDRDGELVQIVDASLADASLRARKADGTSWLWCHAGCTPCCHGVFRISALDAERLRAGLRALQSEDPARAAGIVARAQAFSDELGGCFPGDARTGVLGPEDEAWDTFAGLPQADAPCPALDPATGRCELYDARPLTCRIFGPPVQNDGGIGMCELCYVGASEAEILGGEIHLRHHEAEEELDRELPQESTVIAWALLRE